MSSVKLEDVMNFHQVKVYIEKADQHLEAIGYTEHGFRHATIVSTITRKILTKLEYPQRDVELGGISGIIHDIGNVIGREHHDEMGALIAERILYELGMDPEEIVMIMSAVGNHEEEFGIPTNHIAAALIIGDKADVHRSRVRNPNMISFDIHDRVNYAAKKSFVNVKKEEKIISLELTIDTSISQVMEYFEIFLSRMIICKRAASFLDYNFELIINEVKLL